MDKKVPMRSNTAVDAKAFTLQAYQAAFNETKEAQEDSRIVLFTSSASIIGTVVTSKEREGYVQLNSAMLEKRDKLMQKLGEEKIPFINNASTIQLKNVTIRSFSNPEASLKLPVMNIFADQIVGFTFGEVAPNDF